MKSATVKSGTTLVCFALKEEAAPFRKLAAHRKDLVVLVTGIGRKNSERAVRQQFQNPRPQHVFTCGFAGGLDPKLLPGEVVFATSDVELGQRLQDSGAKSVTFTCADRIASTAAEKRTLRAQTQADAVEMESAIIHAICAERNIPCATVRVISDAAHEDLPLDFNELSNADQSLNFGKLAWTIARSPRKIPALLHLQKQTSSAARQLAAKLAVVFEIVT